MAALVKGGLTMAKTNYNNMSNKKPEPVVEKPVVDEVQPAVEEPTIASTKPKFKRGVVAGCMLLNIRKKPDVSADILGTLSGGEKVVVLDTVGEFYKIEIQDGIAYCMKKYISIK